MPTLEGRLLAKWRARLELTQDDIAKHYPPRQGKKRPTRKRIGDIETLDSSASISTILDVIKAMETAAGESWGAGESQKLIRFFRGPDAAEARQKLREGADDLESSAQRLRQLVDES